MAAKAAGPPARHEIFLFAMRGGLVGPQDATMDDMAEIEGGEDTFYSDILQNLRLRFVNGNIYTSIGTGCSMTFHISDTIVFLGR